jgi:hypothetical protein
MCVCRSVDRPPEIPAHKGTTVPPFPESGKRADLYIECGTREAQPMASSSPSVGALIMLKHGGYVRRSSSAAIVWPNHARLIVLGLEMNA